MQDGHADMEDMENKNRHVRHGKLWLDMEKIIKDFIS